MRLCIPTTDDKGQHAELCDHFGSAPYLTIYDSKTGAYEIVNNSDHEHEHGTCHPMDNLKSKSIDCVVCRGLGRRALEKLHSGRIRVLRTDRSTVEEIVQNFSAEELSEIDAESACQNHRCH
ncbi:MAG: NifB/NifX family molybdenum-iron cluster-binding protein [Phycisphaerales bacterium]|nr:MAG: NifB/NifX family molybdenum-iron cluster-binding protein [Phycisphaerales bacterium]